MKATLVITITLVAAFLITTTLPPVNANAGSDYQEYTITINETVDFSVDASPHNASIQWFCDGVLVKSEYASYSNYTFVPKTTGIHEIKYSVYGFGLCIPKRVTVLAQPQSPTSTPTLTITETSTPKPAQSNMVPLEPIALSILMLAIALSLLLFRRRLKVSNASALNEPH
jgi:hypothetical protein